MKIATRAELTARRAQAQAWLAAEDRVILVCAGTGCIAGGSMKVYETLTALCTERGRKTRVALREEGGHDTLHFKRSGCQGYCEMGPLVEIQPEGILYTLVHPEVCEEILEKTILHGEIIDRLLYKLDGKAYAHHDDIPFYKKQRRVVLETSGNISILPYARFAPACAKDAGIKVEETELPITLISHGTLIRENLAASGRTRAWVEQTLQSYNCRVRDVLLLTAERSGKLYLAIRKEAAS